MNLFNQPDASSFYCSANEHEHWNVHKKGSPNKTLRKIYNGEEKTKG